MNRQPKHFYEFDSFRVEVEERRLLRDGKPVRLTSKVFDILLALLENSGQTIGKNELMKKIWADTFVEEGNLNRNVSTLRRILGDDSRTQKFIKTVPKQGYRFTANVQKILEEDESPEIENVTRSRLFIKGEAQENFWTRRRILSAALIVAIAVGAFGFVWNKMRAGENQSSATQHAAQTKANENFQKGRALWQTRNAEDLHRATLLFEQAAQKEPDFALAHAALADAYAFDYWNWKRAESQANAAIEIDSTLGEPHAAIGFVRTFWEWKLAEAESEFKQAVALSPNYATAHEWYSLNLAARDKKDAALAEIKRAFELEPDSLAVNADLCQVLYFARRYDEAEAQCRQTLAINKNFLNAHLYLYEIYNAEGKSAEAVETYFKIEQLTNNPQPPDVSEKLRKAYQNGGAREFWRKQAEILTRPAPQYYKLAQIYARLGEKDAALNWLEQAYQKRDFDFVFAAADPCFDDFHQDPRYQELMKLILPRVN
jgi:DNA-binding winged helix-turn-helix (wHTH) protein/lipopolysaccharide biosynthesis regulator YciM